MDLLEILTGSLSEKLLHKGPTTAFFQPIIALFMLLGSLFITSMAILLFADYMIEVVILCLVVQAVTIFNVIKAKPLWLLRLYIFHYHMFKDKYAVIEDRLNNWRDYILRNIDDDTDEIWLVGHSNGTLLAPLLLEKQLPTEKIKLITLANLAPPNTVVSVMKEPQTVLKNLSKHEFLWLDISSPADGACFCFI